MALLQMVSVPSSEAPALIRLEAIAILDAQLADAGCFVNVKTGAVLTLRLTARGWIAHYPVQQLVLPFRLQRSHLSMM